jgi:hypothetical protein
MQKLDSPLIYAMCYFCMRKVVDVRENIDVLVCLLEACKQKNY